MTKRSPEDEPPDTRSKKDSPPGNYDIREWSRWLWQTEHPVIQVVHDLMSGALVVLVIGAILFASSGVWPPMVAVESGSMEPTISRGDLIVVVEETRLAPPTAIDSTGVVTYRQGNQSGYRKFGSYGDVIVYRPNGGDRTPIIHRARFWVNESENWYDRANPAFLDGENCQAVPNCPAPQSGLITKGDANSRYDQVMGLSDPVRPQWITGKAMVRIPRLGYIRLVFRVHVDPGG